MKILFLDFDGVISPLNNNEANLFNMDNMQYLANIINCTQAKIVLTTTWRTQWDDSNTPEWVSKFEQFHLTIFDKTPIMEKKHYKDCSIRANEVIAYLSTHKNIEQYAIVDDERWGWGKLDNNFVRIFPNKGLTQQDAQRVIDILNNNAIL